MVLSIVIVDVTIPRRAFVFGQSRATIRTLTRRAQLVCDSPGSLMAKNSGRGARETAAAISYLRNKHGD